VIKINGAIVNFETFPNGETRLPDIKVMVKPKHMDWQTPLVRMNFESDADLMRLVLVSRHLDDIGWGQMKELVIPYLPYSRMDRSEDGSPFTLRYTCDLINSLGWHSVTVGEPHSDVSMALLRNASAIMATPALFDLACQEQGFDPEMDYLYFPDAGAEKRYAKLFPKVKTITGRKTRDFDTGKITGIKADSPDGVRNVVMVDDLCSYGGTFIGGADALKFSGKVFLIVAHCETAIYLGKIPEDDRFIVVYATDSMQSESKHKKVKIIGGIL
jgi:ribose-phosphate pyrophosphokinase